MTDANDEALLRRLVVALSAVPGVEAIALGGSRGRRTATTNSDYDVGLYYRASRPIDVAALGKVAAALDDRGAEASVTPIGRWGRSGGGRVPRHRRPLPDPVGADRRLPPEGEGRSGGGGWFCAVTARFREARGEPLRRSRIGQPCGRTRPPAGTHRRDARPQLPTMNFSSTTELLIWPMD